MGRNLVSGRKNRRYGVKSCNNSTSNWHFSIQGPAFNEKLSWEKSVPDNPLDAASISELFAIWIAHENVHAGMIKAMAMTLNKSALSTKNKIRFTYNRQISFSWSHQQKARNPFRKVKGLWALLLLLHLSVQNSQNVSLSKKLRKSKKSGFFTICRTDTVRFPNTVDMTPMFQPQMLEISAIITITIHHVTTVRRRYSFY